MKFLFLLRNAHEISSSTGAGFLFVFKAYQQAHSKLRNCWYNAEDGQKDKRVVEVISCTFLSIILLFSCSVQKNTAPETASFSGKHLTFARNKGNCLACHAIEDGDFPGNLGPPLKAIQKHFKNKQQLRQQIWDATLFNPNTSMPPFGKNKILTAQEIDKIVNYLWRL